jgi:hypothetical protein
MDETLGYMDLCHLMIHSTYSIASTSNIMLCSVDWNGASNIHA